MNYTDTAGNAGKIINPILSDELNELSGQAFFQQLVSTLIGLGFVVGVIVFVFLLIVGAIRWITSSGDKAATEGARKQITNAFIGLVLLFSVFAIIRLVETIFGINILELTIPTL
ncbi:hypothetical protein C4578_00200 [Candidatus Microgenomates bacterium]|jgi:hypothetical protein|nr:MAG: hypothetical protein C4578_00200 [Candidatus Microgenomates bacterium]